MASLNKSDGSRSVGNVSSKGILANLDTITDRLSIDDERSFYGGLLAPYYSQKYLNDLPLQELKGLFDGISLRVPIITGSITDFVFVCYVRKT